MYQERRHNRSDNIYEALELQLAAVARSAHFSAVVLTEHQGITVACAGKVSDVEELAAFAPQLAPGRRIWQGRVKDKTGAATLVTVAPFETDMGRLYMCAAGGDEQRREAALLTGGKGVYRILA